LSYYILCFLFLFVAITFMKTFRTIRPVVLILTLIFANAPFAAAREPERAKHGMVASTNEVASRVGVDIMRRGGNAVDAAIAVAFALAVTHPAAGNLGGGGFMLIRLKDSSTTAIDYREMAPLAAHRNVYLDKDGNVIKGEGGSLVGYRAAGVPGTVRGMELALKKYGSGKLTWAQLVEPARRLAANGFTVTYSLARSLHSTREYLST
jgi:gamma-glutamyltranspeptidase/glutathione hydrolase